MVDAAKKAKAAWIKHGAEYVYFSRIHTGPDADSYLFVVRCKDWTSFGAVQDKMAKDTGFQALLKKVLGMAKLSDRTIAVGIDI